MGEIWGWNQNKSDNLSPSNHMLVMRIRFTSTTYDFTENRRLLRLKHSYNLIMCENFMNTAPDV